MMIAVSVMTVIVMGGTIVFFRTLSSGGINQAQLNVTSSGNQVLQAIENSVKYEKVKSVSDGTNTYERDACVLAGKTGGSVSGNSLTVYDQFDTTNYTLANDKLSSNSAVISSPNLVIKSVSFEWTCLPGSYDKLRVTLVSNDSGLSSSVPDRTLSRDINMYNSF